MGLSILQFHREETNAKLEAMRLSWEASLQSSLSAFQHVLLDGMQQRFGHLLPPDGTPQILSQTVAATPQPDGSGSASSSTVARFDGSISVAKGSSPREGSASSTHTRSEGPPLLQLDSSGNSSAHTYPRSNHGVNMPFVGLDSMNMCVDTSVGVRNDMLGVKKDKMHVGDENVGGSMGFVQENSPGWPPDGAQPVLGAVVAVGYPKMDTHKFSQQDGSGKIAPLQAASTPQNRITITDGLGSASSSTVARCEGRISPSLTFGAFGDQFLSNGDNNLGQPNVEALLELVSTGVSSTVTDTVAVSNMCTQPVGNMHAGAGLPNFAPLFGNFGTQQIAMWNGMQYSNVSPGNFGGNSTGQFFEMESSQTAPVTPQPMPVNHNPNPKPQTQQPGYRGPNLGPQSIPKPPLPQTNVHYTSFIATNSVPPTPNAIAETPRLQQTKTTNTSATITTNAGLAPLPIPKPPNIQANLNHTSANVSVPPTPNNHVNTPKFQQLKATSTVATTSTIPNPQQYNYTANHTFNPNQPNFSYQNPPHGHFYYQQPYPGQVPYPHFDDILIYNKSVEEHVMHLEKVFRRLQQHDLRVKLSKCSFGVDSVEYLGHIITAAWVAVDPKKIECIKNWDKPKTLKGLRGFLGLAGYYRKYVMEFGLIAKPLTDMLKTGEFQWTPQSEKAFEDLKYALMNTPVLALPNFTKEFTIECDASGIGIGAVLAQEGHPIAYLSKALAPRHLAMSVYDKGMLAVVFAVQYWRPYLLGNHFKIYTDHRTIQHFLEQKITTPTQQKWLLKLAGYDYSISYKAGKLNAASNALSRREDLGKNTEDMVQKYVQLNVLSGISSPVSDFMQEIQVACQGDSEAQQVITKLQQDVNSCPKFSLQNNQLLYKGKIFVPHSGNWREKIMGELHSGFSGGHDDRHRTLKRITRSFAWSKMVVDVKKFVAECPICQQNYYESIQPPGLQQPNKIPDKAWTCISMDFGLPSSNGKSVILVVVDWLTKYAHFLPLSHPYTAVSVAQQFIQGVYKLHGMPDSIITDRDPVSHVSLYYGPYEIEKRIGTVAYQPKLPPGARIHLVLHVSLLKKKVGNAVVVAAHLPPDIDPHNPRWYPAKILARGIFKKGNAAVTKWLVQWLLKRKLLGKKLQICRLGFQILQLEDKLAVTGRDC